MKVLVTGSTGLLGGELMAALAHSRCSAVAMNRAAFLSADKEMRSLMLQGFDVVIHAAANTNVEECELFPEACYHDNCFFTEQLFCVARQQGAKFVFISSTGIYGKGKSTPYHEYDSVSPTTIHHSSKRIAEEIVLAAADSLVVRTGWLFGGCLENRKNFVANRVKEISAADGFIYANSSQIGSPTYVRDCAARLVDLLLDDCAGIYNIVNAQSASRFDYVKEIVELSGAALEVRPIDAGGFNRHADVSDNESAISYRMRFEGRQELRPWKDALAEYMRDVALLGTFSGDNRSS